MQKLNAAKETSIVSFSIDTNAASVLRLQNAPFAQIKGLHIEVTAVGGQWWEVEAFKSNRMKLKQKPVKFSWQYRENGIDSQRARVPLLDFMIVQSIKTS